MGPEQGLFFLAKITTPVMGQKSEIIGGVFMNKQLFLGAFAIGAGLCAGKMMTESLMIGISRLLIKAIADGAMKGNDACVRACKMNNIHYKPKTECKKETKIGF